MKSVKTMKSASSVTAAEQQAVNQSLGRHKKMYCVLFGLYILFLFPLSY